MGEVFRADGFVDNRARRPGQVVSLPVPARYECFDRDEWAKLRAATPLTLDNADLARLSGINENVDVDEVVAVYLPLSRLLNLHVRATMDLHETTSTFLGKLAPKVPYVIGVAGSVAVGKSTFSRILQTLLARWPDHPRVELVTTDGFLYPNETLEARGIMHRKGFPESYDARALLSFLHDLKSGAPVVTAPVYSHVGYDIVAGEELAVTGPDILILEGLNLLQVGTQATSFVSDYFDFSIYIDADEADIEDWYVDRFLTLRASVFQNPESYFAHYADLDDAEAVSTAQAIWESINRPNLRDHIEPTRERATLVMHKASDHRVDQIRLRKL
jgi:type I pantothenate kinase